MTIQNSRGLPAQEAALYLGCSRSKFEDMVRDGSMPKPRMIGTKRVWDRFELDEAFDALPRQEDRNEWDEDEAA